MEPKLVDFWKKKKEILYYLLLNKNFFHLSASMLIKFI